MDLYTILKTLHVLSAIAWVGGGLLGATLAIRAARGSDDMLLAAMAQLAWCADRVFVPAAVATLAFGLGMTWLGGLWLETWVLIGLGGIAATMALGAGVLGPRIARALKLEAEGHAEAAARLARQVLHAARFDATLLILVVVDMVLRPTLGDWPVIAGMAVAALAGAALFIPPALAKPLPPQTASAKDIV